MRSFGRAFRMLEAWVEAELTEEIREAVVTIFGDSPEYRLVEVLASAKNALPLYEISSRCHTSRRSVLASGRLRRALERIEASEIIVNVGTLRRPRYQLNLTKNRAKLLISLVDARKADPRPEAWMAASSGPGRTGAMIRSKSSYQRTQGCS